MWFKVGMGVWVTIVIMTLWRLMAAYFLPVVQDEAYYFLWAKFLDFGYFDHPPLVALMAYSHNFAIDSHLVSRLGTIITATLILAVTTSFFFHVGLKQKWPLLVGVLLFNLNLMGLIYGFIATPDTILLLGWVLALHEGFFAIKGQRSRWLTAGIATGIGLLSKYTMLLIGPVFLYGILKSDRGALKTPWPYLGAALALSIFSPHLIWNAENDWITFRFQGRHGFALERPEMPKAQLPVPEEAVAGDEEFLLAEQFAGVFEAQSSGEKKPHIADPFLKLLNRYFGFYGAQLGLWGFLLIPMIMGFLKRRKSLAKGQEVDRQTLDGQPLLLAGCFFPLIVFGLIALFVKVEANWSAMYIVGAVPLLVKYVAGHKRLLILMGSVNLLLMGAVIVHAKTGLLPLRPHRDRILQETHGYPELAQIAADLSGPLFGDSYQIVSMIRYYAPQVQIEQWPGITRHSELTRRATLQRARVSHLVAAASFWLITTRVPPPKIAGFTASGLKFLRDCKTSQIQVLDVKQEIDAEARCKTPIHEWYLVHYEVLDERKSS